MRNRHFLTRKISAGLMTSSLAKNFSYGIVSRAQEEMIAISALAIIKATKKPNNTSEGGALRRTRNWVSMSKNCLLSYSAQLLKSAPLRISLMREAAVFCLWAPTFNSPERRPNRCLRGRDVPWWDQRWRRTLPSSGWRPTEADPLWRTWPLTSNRLEACKHSYVVTRDLPGVALVITFLACFMTLFTV